MTELGTSLATIYVTKCTFAIGQAELIWHCILQT